MNFLRIFQIYLVGIYLGLIGEPQPVVPQEALWLCISSKLSGAVANAAMTKSVYVEEGMKCMHLDIGHLTFEEIRIGGEVIFSEYIFTILGTEWINHDINTPSKSKFK